MGCCEDTKLRGPSLPLPWADAERKLRIASESVKPLGKVVSFDAFWAQAGNVVHSEGRRYPDVILVLGTVPSWRVVMSIGMPSGRGGSKLELCFELTPTARSYTRRAGRIPSLV